MMLNTANSFKMFCWKLVIYDFSNNYLITAVSSPHSPSFPSHTYFTAHSPTFPSLYVHHSTFSNPSVALPTSQLILQPFHCFTYRAELILQAFCCFTYITAHSPTLLLLHLHHSSFSNLSFSSTSQTLHFTSPGEPPMPSSGKFKIKFMYEV